MRVFPLTRLRRNRKAAWSRRLVQQVSLSNNDLILPVFIKEGRNEKEPISSMPGVYRLSIDNLIKKAMEARDLGIPAIAVFPYIDQSLKDESAKEALNKDNLVNRAIKELKEKVPEIGVIVDIALDPYTIHGHDGIIDETGSVINDKTIDVLVKQAILAAHSGADVVAPSDMMDGRIVKIREALESENFHNTQILAYCAKYASCFYAPFRDAVGSKGLLGMSDKKTYQMDITNPREAIAEAEMDITEGADMIMVKPGLPYLDVIAKFAERYDVPILAYQVSGEYSMIKVAAEAKIIDEEKAFLETMLCFKRAGCNAIFTYAAIEIAKML